MKALYCLTVCLWITCVLPFSNLLWAHHEGITLTSNSVTVSLDQSNSELTIGDLYFTWDSSDFTLTFSGSGVFTRSGGSDTVAYTLSTEDSGSGTLTATLAVPGHADAYSFSGGDYVMSFSNGVATDRRYYVQVNNTANTTALKGSYTTTLTVTIATQ